MSLQDARMPSLSDKIEAQAAKAQAEKAEADAEREDIQDLERSKIIKKKSKKNEN